MPSVPPLDLDRILVDVRPVQPVSAADRKLADELESWGRGQVPEGSDHGVYPVLQGISRLGQRAGEFDPDRVERVYRVLWWRAMKAVQEGEGWQRRTLESTLIGVAVTHYQTLQQSARLVPFYKAQVRLGEARSSPVERFRGNAGLANYAYTIGQREAFERYAERAMTFAADACAGKGSSLGAMPAKQTFSAEEREEAPEMYAEIDANYDATFNATAKLRTDAELFPDLGILMRQLSDQRLVEPMQRLARTAVTSDQLSGRLCYQIALTLGEQGFTDQARALAGNAPAAYRDELGPAAYYDNGANRDTPGAELMIARYESIKLRAAGEAELVPLLLAHYRGERPRPWAEVARLSGKLWQAERLSQGKHENAVEAYRVREQALTAGWKGLRRAFTSPLSAERVRGQALPFLLDGFFEASPLIETLEEAETDLALALYLVGVSTQEGARKGVSLEDRAQLFDAVKNRTLYRGLLRTLARRGKPGDADRAWAVSELSRARQLKELLASDTAREVASLSQPLDLAKRLRARLKPGQALVGYHLLPKHLLVLTLTQAKSRAVLIPLDTRAFSARVSGLHEALANRRATDVGARLLAVGRVLLRPVAKLLAGKKRLFVLPDGVLHTVPFDVLPGVEGRPLLESLAVTVLPSAETLLRAPRKAASEARLFALADPVYPKLSTAAGSGALDVAQAKTRGAKGIPALPETRAEVTAIGGLFKNKTILLGTDARESAVKGRDLRAFSHVHFATHGVLAYELPNVTEPALILSGESGEDAFLTASEARRLKLNADVCVLSACNTGSGKVLNGEGVLGLSRAFLLAGSRAVLVSLWPVASEATKDLMIRFYKHVNAGKPKAEALRLAKLELARRGAKGGGTRGFGGIVSGKPTTPVDAKGDGRHPFFWAPFVLVGGD
jgi:CHAT domain-containing protein